MHLYQLATITVLATLLCSCHKKPEQTVELKLKDVMCYTRDKAGVCEEKGRENGFEIAEIPEEYREQFLTECGANIPCDVTLTLPQYGKPGQNICQIFRMVWKRAT